MGKKLCLSVVCQLFAGISSTTYQLSVLLVQPLTGKKTKKRAMESQDSMALFQSLSTVP
jgi:hypothetical protein